MAHDEFTMNTGQAHEFAQACGRNGLSRRDVKFLSSGNRLAQAIAYLRSGAPPFIDPSKTFVYSPPSKDLEALWIYPNLECFVDLNPCVDDDRELRSIFVPQSKVSSTTDIAIGAGGMDILVACKATIGQLIREVNLARAGEKGIFKRTQTNIICLEGCNGSFVMMSIRWSFVERVWRVQYHLFNDRFDQVGGWSEALEVFGN